MVATLLLSIQNGTIRFGDKTLFEGLTFNLQEGEKICLVGQNGAGKTTLMNIITGLRELDEGVRWTLQGTRIGYLQQDVPRNKGQTVYEFIFDELEPENKSHDNLYKIERIIEPLQLDIHDQMDHLSGGQVRRAALARSLVDAPDVLLLDEPTNHLDLDVIEWLENYLKSYRGSFLCVSHDKTFLKNISNRVFWLDRGSLKICPKGFAFFEEWSLQLLEQEEQTLRHRQKNLDQEVTWASRGVQGRRKRNVRRLEQMKSDRDKLRRDQNALSRMMDKVKMDPLAAANVPSNVVCEFYNVSKSFPATEAQKEKNILDQFFLRVIKRDRIGIIGLNGSGKTTFLKLLTGQIKQDGGTIKRAKTMEVSYFDQNRQDLREDWTLQKNLIPSGGDTIDVNGSPRHVCGYLKDFLFDPKRVRDSVSTLSGGQKNRLMLAKILANPGNLLILDEPTNDLDMETLDRLEDILASYTGTLIVVSHDRDFLDQNVSKILAFEGDAKVEVSIGGYEDYRLMRDKRDAGKIEAKAPLKALPKKKEEKTARSDKLSYKLQYELDHMPEKIEKLEADFKIIEKRLADPSLFNDNPEEFQKMSTTFQRVQEQLEEAMIRWLELEAMG